MPQRQLRFIDPPIDMQPEASHDQVTSPSMQPVASHNPDYTGPTTTDVPGGMYGLPPKMDAVSSHVPSNSRTQTSIPMAISTPRMHIGPDYQEPHPVLGDEPKSQDWYSMRAENARKMDRGVEGVKDVPDLMGRAKDLYDQFGWMLPDMPQFGPGMVAGTTRFLTANRIPSKEARKAATEAFKREAAALGPEMKAWGEWFAENWPRVAAHRKELPTLNTSGVSWGAMTHPFGTRIETLPNWKPGDRLPYIKRMPIEWSDILNHLSAREKKAVLAHEGVHVAQFLGNREGPMINMLMKRVLDYEDLPSEGSAARRQLGTFLDWTPEEYRALVRKPRNDADRLMMSDANLALRQGGTGISARPFGPGHSFTRDTKHVVDDVIRQGYDIHVNNPGRSLVDILSPDNLRALQNSLEIDKILKIRDEKAKANFAKLGLQHIYPGTGTP